MGNFNGLSKSVRCQQTNWREQKTKKILKLENKIDTCVFVTLKMSVIFLKGNRYLV